MRDKLHESVRDLDLKEILLAAHSWDGDHHKRWWIEQALILLGFNLKKLKKQTLEEGYSWEDGVAP